MATNPTAKTWPNRPLTMDDIAYCEENGCGFPTDRYYEFPPDGHRHRLRTAGLKQPVWEFKGPSTQGKWRSTGCTDERDAMIYMWEHAQVGVLLGEALRMFPAAESTKKHDEPILAFFGPNFPLRQISADHVQRFIDARRAGDVQIGKASLRPAKDITIKRNVRRLHHVLTRLQQKEQFEGNLAAIHHSNFDWRKDNKKGEGVFVDEYQDIRESLPSEGYRLVLDFLTVFAADEIAAHRARRDDIKLDRTKKWPHGYIEIRGTKTPDRGKPKPLNAQTRAFAIMLRTRVAGSQDRNPLLFPELVSRNGTPRFFGEIMRGSWSRSKEYKEKGRGLTCPALRRTCFTFLRRYLERDDCDLYLGHSVKGVTEHYDRYSIIDLAPKLEEVRFPFIPDAGRDERGEEAVTQAHGASRIEHPESRAALSLSATGHEACDESATPQLRPQPAEITGDWSENQGCTWPPDGAAQPGP